MFNSSRYRVIAIGKIRKSWIKEGLDLYQKRMPGLTITELRDNTPQRETESILSTLRSNEDLITLTEEGELFSSLTFADELKKQGSQRLAFVIGGANGIPPEIKKSAKWALSLSPLTFPHEISRLLLLEQLYRAQTIQQGSPYHRE
tara:strand:+ start:115 stop:552 length:438 start_codon:yes stop_codon:yes gene_type:complete